MLGHLEQRAKAADAGQHTLAQRAFGQGLDAFNQSVAGVNVHAGVLVAEW